MKYVVFGLVVMLCCAISSVRAQKDVEQPIGQWSIGDAQKMIKDSPWSKPYQSTRALAAADALAVGREQSQNANSGGSNPRSVGRYLGPPIVTLRLHSAEPLRRAIVRLQREAVGYEKMSPEEQAKFDASRKTFLECAICKDYYVLTLSKSVDKNSGDIEEGIFQAMTFAQLKGNVKLVNNKGEERELVQFNAPKSGGDSAVFYFKRLDNSGKPLIGPDTKEFKFVFDNAFLDSSNRWAFMLPNSFEFKVSKITVGDRVLF